MAAERVCAVRRVASFSGGAVGGSGRRTVFGGQRAKVDAVRGRWASDRGDDARKLKDAVDCRPQVCRLSSVCRKRGDSLCEIVSNKFIIFCSTFLFSLFDRVVFFDADNRPKPVQYQKGSM
jgi:hypothetical protein